MNDFLGKFSLSLILRQFFCGVVFCVPCMLTCFPDGFTIDAVSEFSTDILLPVAIASLIIGTVIYHVEKNTYSYAIQGLFLTVLETFSFIKDKRVSSKIETYKMYFHILLIILMAVDSFLFFWVDDRNIWMCVSGAAALLVVNLMLSSIVTFYQKAWSIDQQRVLGANSSIDAKLVMGHLDTWSDNIHCVQCCCFAWLAGSAFSHWLSIRNIMDTCQCMRAVFGSSWEVLNTSIHWAILSPYGKLACIILFLELIFEFHRFRHLYKIVKGR